MKAHTKRDASKLNRRGTITNAVTTANLSLNSKVENVGDLTDSVFVWELVDKHHAFAPKLMLLGPVVVSETFPGGQTDGRTYVHNLR